MDRIVIIQGSFYNMKEESIDSQAYVPHPQSLESVSRVFGDGKTQRQHVYFLLNHDREFSAPILKAIRRCIFAAIRHKGCWSLSLMSIHLRYILQIFHDE